MVRNLDLLFVSVIAIATALAAPTFAGQGIVSLVALPLVLVLPGYALSAALLPASRGSLEETALHSLGLSLALVVLLGLGLNFTPWGLGLLSWATALPALTVAGCLVAFIRRRGASRPVRVASAQRVGAGLGVQSGIFFGLSLLVLISALAVTRLSLAAEPTPEFAQLWMQPADPAGQNRYDLGVRNAGPTPAVFRLEASVGDTLVYQFSEITLAPGETWERIVEMPSPSANMEKLKAELYQQDSNDLYRHVDIWTSGQ